MQLAAPQSRSVFAEQGASPLGNGRGSIATPRCIATSSASCGSAARTAAPCSLFHPWSPSCSSSVGALTETVTLTWLFVLSCWTLSSQGLSGARTDCWYSSGGSQLLLPLASSCPGVGCSFAQRWMLSCMVLHALQSWCWMLSCAVLLLSCSGGGETAWLCCAVRLSSVWAGAGDSVTSPPALHLHTSRPT